MIDPRFAAAGAIPLAAGYGTQQAPIQYHHHRHHRHHKHKTRNDESPLSRDESIHKVDHGQPNFSQNNDVPFGSGYGVPYGTTGFGAADATGFQQQQQQQQQQHQYPATNFGYANQYQGTSYGQGPFTGAPLEQSVRQHRRHRRHHRHHNVEAVNAPTQEEPGETVPEQLIGQRSSSAVNNEEQEVRSPAPLGDAENLNESTGQRRHRRHHRTGNPSLGQNYQSRQPQGHTTAGSDGYGHINDELIFIERGDHSPHRQDAPTGYEYKGKIEVHGIDRDIRSRAHTSGAVIPPTTQVPQTVVPTVPTTQPVASVPSLVACPPGWQQMIMSAAPGGPCPPGTMSYAGQTLGAMGVAQPGMGGFGANPYGSYGIGATPSGYANYGTGVSYPSQCQYIADYVFGSNVGAVGTTTGGGYTTGYQQPTTATTGITEQYKSDQVEEHVSVRPTIIEVWQKRSKSEKPDRPRRKTRSRSPSYPSVQPRPRSRSRSRSPSRHRSRSPVPGPSFDFERFRSDILKAIERMVPRPGPAPVDIQPTKGHGGTQTQIRPSIDDDHHIKPDKRPETTSGEVRVIVQPIQPVFYMPRQTTGSTQQTQIPGPIRDTIGPAPPMPQPTPSGAPNVVYVPRNVYVPVIKPVFVPRERVIVRPQVIHVARPVLVDRPVPVTQRPIIIDRERPIPVPVRGGGQATAQTGDSKVVREEYVYRDNLPVAYGGRCPEFAGGVNYGYMPTQQEHQYATSSTHETSNIYQTQAPTVNVNASEQYQHSQSASHFEGQQAACATFQGTYEDLVRGGESFDTPLNNNYLGGQSEQQYASSSTQETGNVYQAEGSGITVNVPNQYQHSQSASNIQIQQENISGSRSFHESYSSFVGGNNTTAVNVDQQNQDYLQQTLEQSAQASGILRSRPTQIEVLDTAVNPFWQKTDQSTLVRRYGRPAFEIVHKSEEVEQQMYNELRQRASSTGVMRSASTGSYGSGSGIGVNGSGIGQY